MEYEQKVALKSAMQGLNEGLARAVKIFTGFTRASKSAYGTPSGILYHKNREVFAVRINIDGCGEVHIGTYADDVSALAAWKTAKIADLESLRKRCPEMPDNLYNLLKGLVEGVEL